MVYVELIGVGLMAGFLAGLLGIGGGFVVVPALAIAASGVWDSASAAAKGSRGYLISRDDSDRGRCGVCATQAGRDRLCDAETNDSRSMWGARLAARCSRLRFQEPGSPLFSRATPDTLQSR